MKGVVQGLGGGGGYKIKLFKFNPPPLYEILSYASGNRIKEKKKNKSYQKNLPIIFNL